ncbi:hypothetical protein [Microbacterium sp. E-13]|uniref:hypothetical protein n=1 Tax=Microbacterium sp. E-13 TaxID=3404048 RepID=UPI003CF6E7B1
MNDLTFVGTIVARQREADLVREIELMRSHREHGATLARPHGRRLGEWFRTAIARTRPRGVVAA